jgi:hypothetical protein
MHHEYGLRRCTNKSRFGLIQDERVDLPWWASGLDDVEGNATQY